MHFVGSEWLSLWVSIGFATQAENNPSQMQRDLAHSIINMLDCTVPSRPAYHTRTTLAPQPFYLAVWADGYSNLAL